MNNFEINENSNETLATQIKNLIKGAKENVVKAKNKVEREMAIVKELEKIQKDQQ